MSEQAGIEIVRIDHVNVTTPEDLEAETVAWYRDVLGLTPIEKPAGTRGGGAWFALGEMELHLSVDEHNPHKTAHVGLLVRDFNGAVDHLRSAGCHVEQASSIPGRHRCYTRDPAGNRIEIAQLDEPDAEVLSVEAGDERGETDS